MVSTGSAGTWESFTITEVSGSSGSDCSVISSNGEYNVIISNDSGNPTITFDPILSGAGNETLIIYYSTDPDATFAGEFTSPNTAYSLNASAGETVYVYYTYSVSTGGEHTTYGSPNSFTVGDCSSLKAAGNASITGVKNIPTKVFPNPVSKQLNIDFNRGKYNQIQLLDISGQLVYSGTLSGSTHKMTIENLDNGVYILILSGVSSTEALRIIKE